MASPRPDPLRAVDRVLAPLTWLAAALAIAVLLVGPQLIGADRPAAAKSQGGAAASGEQVFVDAGCGGCHTLAAAGAGGVSGPNLDSLKPDAGVVAAAVEGGKAGMPACRRSAGASRPARSRPWPPMWLPPPAADPFTSWAHSWWRRIATLRGAEQSGGTRNGRISDRRRPG